YSPFCWIWKFKKANTLGVSFLLKLGQKSQHLSVNFLCPSLFTGIFAYLYSLKSEFFPSNW
ncbi:hypothetical protein, partial [Mesomycoplasma ovipneumoniae]|uniref:hypothetical protein n=1 Tax=Mesomycoplasma ovipneumoniae TaxID=29562 RepID=UPI0030809D8B